MSTGYANRFIRLDFPDLGDDVYVEIRNPKTVDRARLSYEPSTPALPGASADDMATYVITANIVRDWHMFDATSDDDDQPVLPLPATPEACAKLPVPVLQQIAKHIREALNPPR